MKFGKRIKSELVEEWANYYVDYKVCLVHPSPFIGPKIPNPKPTIPPIHHKFFTLIIPSIQSPIRCGHKY